MTLEQAFEDLIKSTEFKEIAKARDSKGGKYRSYLSRFNAGQLKAGALVEILMVNGYEVKANKVSKKTKL